MQRSSQCVRNAVVSCQRLLRRICPGAVLGATAVWCLMVWLELGVLVAQQQPVASVASGMHQMRGKHGMVVSASRPASEVGRKVIQDGGNAVDAAVSVALALAVTWPEAGNLGGGGFMMVHPGDERPAVCVDYRETAPAAATKTMFGPRDGRHTHKIVGVPGTVRGLALAHQKFGTLPWKRLVQPAARLAAEGFTVDRHLAGSLNGVLRSRSVRAGERFAELRRVYGKPGGENWRAGDRLVLPDLAVTLTQIAEEGADVFYRGRPAAQLVAEMQRGDGLITAADLHGYQARVRAPIRGVFRGYQVLGPPPPSSGGICITQALHLLEAAELKQYGRYSREAVHLLAETSRRIFCDRARHLGDADFVPIPARLTDPAYARELLRQMSRQRATASEALAPDISLAGESESTTHFSVVDGAGMAVSNTYTLEASWGARIVVKGAGFLLNNEMGDFNWVPGETNRRGRIGTKANLIEPGKRMLSSQSPVIVTRGGRAVLVAGSPGGRTIINTVIGILVNTLEYEMSLPEAVDAPRMHHQWFPDQLILEADSQRHSPELVAELKAMGHAVRLRRQQGSVHAIQINPDTGALHGVADRRRGGHAAGF
ncbi:MAG: gamma-glutamyltransferase [Planctomycetaceae bacterium]|nr:gamma-glutamyltransferase [Planctomycetaceae bacterium]